MIPMQKNQFHPTKGLDTALAFMGIRADGTWRWFEGMKVQPGLHDWFWSDLGDAIDHCREAVESARLSQLADNTELSSRELTPNH